jgi:hypothetical protein
LTGKRPRRPSGAAAIACLALLLALGGTVYAAGKSHKLSGAKIKKSSIAGNRFKKDTVTGKQVNESTLGPVAGAEAGGTLENEERFNLRIGFGQSQTLFTAGPLAFTATCLQNVERFPPPEPRFDVARILVSTSAGKAVFDGSQAKRGSEPSDFLEPTTPESERVFEEDSAETGTTHYDADSSEEAGAYSDSGVGVSFEDDGLAMGENIGGPGCLFTGTAIIETP